jgi:peptide/nickel transport system substrate-binding protein
MNRRSFLKTAGRAAAVWPVIGAALGSRDARAQGMKTLVVAWDTDIDTLDPARFKTMGGYVTVCNTYDTPIMWKVRELKDHPGFYRSRPGEFDPHLAASWHWEDDGATLVMKVRRGVKFPSGRPVTAHAFKYSFDRGLLSPGYMRIIIPKLLLVNSPDQFKVRDDFTFAIHMQKPTPMAMDIVALSNNAIFDADEVKSHATKEDPWARTWLNRHIAGVGPFRLAKNEPGVEVVLEASSGYWRPRPYFDRIVLKFVKDESARVLLLKRKAIDMVVGRPGLSPKNVKALEGEPGLKVFSVPDTTCHFLGMNMAKSPFDKVKVRQAVNYAIPAQAILPNVLFGYATKMTSPVPHLTPGHLGDYSPYKHDIDKARALMKEAGVHGPIPVDLAVRVGWQTHEQAAIWIQRELEKIGFKVNIVKETEPTFRQLAIKGGHTMSIEAWQSWVNDPLYHLFFNLHSKAKFTNVVRYSNPEFDRLIDENMHETNAEKRLRAVHQAQKIAIDEAAWGFLWYDSWTRVMQANLVGLEKRWDTFERYYSVKRI